jgi:transposase
LHACRRCAARSAGREGAREAERRPRLRLSQRRQLRRRGITAEIARRKTEHGSGLGRYRWVVERTFAWLHQLKRLLVRYDRRAEMHEAFLAIGCCLVCFRRLTNSSL